MSARVTRLTGLLLVVTPVLLTACLTLLQIIFGYPAILREPVSVVLPAFQAGGPTLIAVWYGSAFSALLFIPAVVMLHSILSREDDHNYLDVATVLGVLGGLVQSLGLIRWVFVVPYLAEVYLDPSADQATRGATAVVFEALNRYAGMAVGEHLGYVLTSVWLAVVSLTFRRSRLVPRFLSWFGLALAPSIFVGVFEPLGVEVAGLVNFIGYTLFALWLVTLGVTLVSRAPAVGPAVQAARARA